MMKYIIFAVFLLDIFLASTSSRRVPFFRTDYTYVENFDAFYKVHMLHDWDIRLDFRSVYRTAFHACANEEATLFYPKAEGERALVKNLTNEITQDSNVTDIIVGFHDEYKIGEFITVDGLSIPDPLASDSSLLPDPTNDERAPLPRHNYCVTMNLNSGEFTLENCLKTPETPLPFVCKKVEDKSCPTVDRGYNYTKASRKCYKINTKLKLWQEAMKTCVIEGGILAVIENEAQAEAVRDMLEPGVSYFVGVRQIISTQYRYNFKYYTVNGKKFSDMYQNQDQEQSSRQWDYGTVVNRDSQLYTKTAMDTERLPFICEMEVLV